MEHGDPNQARLAAGKIVELVWHFTRRARSNSRAINLVISTPACAAGLLSDSEQ
jgi:hypothetical protein